jgi:8-oxo-dGTP pyrophosphatase MutT (NUDIX family)
MHRKSLLESLNDYAELHKRFYSDFSEEMLEPFRVFVQETPECFQREHVKGHVTASAFVLSRDCGSVLLTFHAKLKQWMQLGGHADGHFLVHEVALKEAQEESGAHKFSFMPIFPSKEHVPFDLDIHLIPATGSVPEHFHYDARFLMQCHDEDKIVLSEESLDLQWISLEKVSEYTKDPSVLRQVNKTKHYLRSRK